MLGVLETVLILVALLVLFGGSRLPALSKGIGKMIRNIKFGVRGDDGIEVRERPASDNHPEAR